MKIFTRILFAVVVVTALVSCDAFNSLTRSRLKTSQGKPYELIVVCSQQEWNGEVGDTLRALLTTPVPYLNQTEPLFDILRVTERGFTNMIVDHRNILKVLVDASVPAAAVAVQYNATSEPQIVLTLQGPTSRSLVDYLNEHGQSLVQVLEKAERDRAVEYAARFGEKNLQKAIKDTFGVEMDVPKGYVLAAQEKDFVWARFEYPTASQGFILYTYPYEGPQSLSPEALLAARNKFAARIPGPADGSYMTTSAEIEPGYQMFRLEGRLWCELRGFWDVEGDFMGGPFVSYSTVDTATNQVFTLDGYVFAPNLHKPSKRNYVRGIEHLLYMIRFPDTQK